MTIGLDKIILFFLIFVRIGAIITTAPVLGSPSVPIRIKLTLAIFLSFIFLPMSGDHREMATWGYFDLSLAVLKEMALGITAGFVATLSFTAINLSGQLMGFHMGFAIVNIMDPLNQTQVSIISQFLGFLALVLFITVNGHYWFIEAISQSFKMISPGDVNISSMVVGDVMKVAADLFVIALKIGAPLFAIMIAIYVGLGIVARTVPQMNVFIIGFPLTIGVGLIGIGLTLPLFFEVLKDVFNTIGRDLSDLMRIM